MALFKHRMALNPLAYHHVRYLKSRFWGHTVPRIQKDPSFFKEEIMDTDIGDISPTIIMVILGN